MPHLDNGVFQFSHILLLLEKCIWHKCISYSSWNHGFYTCQYISHKQAKGLTQPKSVFRFSGIDATMGLWSATTTNQMMCLHGCTVPRMSAKLSGSVVPSFWWPPALLQGLFIGPWSSLCFSTTHNIWFPRGVVPLPGRPTETGFDQASLRLSKWGTGTTHPSALRLLLVVAWCSSPSMKKTWADSSTRAQASFGLGAVLEQALAFWLKFWLPPYTISWTCIPSP